MQITYGKDNQRIKSVLKNNGAVIKTKYYIPGYEKEVTAGGTRELHYVNSPYGLVAILIKQGGNTVTPFQGLQSLFYPCLRFHRRLLTLRHTCGVFVRPFRGFGTSRQLPLNNICNNDCWPFERYPYRLR
jgi:hypothetical protein